MSGKVRSLTVIVIQNDSDLHEKILPCLTAWEGSYTNVDILKVAF